jgi:hypothetical protein
MPKVLRWKRHGINGKRYGTFGTFGSNTTGTGKIVPDPKF